MRNKSKGYTLFGLLLASAILLLLASYSICLFADRQDPEFVTKREAQEFENWLGERMSVADAQGSSFSLRFLTSKNGKNWLRLTWTSGRFNATYSDFEPSDCTMSYSGTSECVYSGEWHTLTPAATFTFYCSKGTKSATKRVSISALGYINSN